MIDAQDRLILWLHYGTELHYKLFARIRETYFYLEEALEDVKKGDFSPMYWAKRWRRPGSG